MPGYTLKQIEKGAKQYVLLGAGLATFAQRNMAISSEVGIFEIDQPGTLSWKEEKLIENGYKIDDNLHLVPVDFEVSSWWDKLLSLIKVLIYTTARISRPVGNERFSSIAI